MRLVRFMGLTEFEKLMRGETLYNTTDWKKRNQSGSVGFCFFPLTDKHDTYWAYDKLWGIVDPSVCVVFECTIKLKKSYGYYASGWWTSERYDEYCVTEYNKTMLKPIEYTFSEIPSEYAIWHDVAEEEEEKRRWETY